MKMPVLRKSILYAVVGAAFVLCAAVFSMQKSGEQVTILPPAASETTDAAQPVALAVIDAGHGGRDHGASGTHTGVYEDELNLDVALKLRDELERLNISVILTRETSDAIAPTKREDMKKRRSIMHDSGADLALSIHMNKFTDSAVHGAMVFYAEGDEASAELAQAVIDSICDETGMPRRRTNTGDYYVIRNSDIPAVIVECGFLSNSGDERLLSDADYRAALARAIARGVYRYVTGE